MRADRDRTLSTEEAAEYLSIHPDSVRRLLRQGKLPGGHVGGDNGAFERLTWTHTCGERNRRGRQPF
jgi:excisionase family DNA binding protein